MLVPNVLIRDVPEDDLEQIRAVAAEKGMSLQAFLREAVHTQAAHLRRRAALQRAADRLRAAPATPAEERLAVLDAVDEERSDR